MVMHLGFWGFGVLGFGGLVSDMDGGHQFLESGNIVAANTQLYKNLIKTLNNAIKTT